MSLDSIDTLVGSNTEAASRNQKDEARELYKAGLLKNGPMSRQRGEPMTSYVSCRVRWHRRLQLFDPDTIVSENILAEPLLAGSGITHQKKLFVLTVTENRCDV